MDFGQEIRKRREAAGLTLEALAERSNLSPNYIGGIESGKRDPSLSTLLMIAQGLRVSAADLLGGLKEMSPSAIEVGRLFEATSPRIQSAVIQLIRSIIYGDAVDSGEGQGDQTTR